MHTIIFKLTDNYYGKDTYSKESLVVMCWQNIVIILEFCRSISEAATRGVL